MGNLLFLETIKYLMKNGIYKFDFLRGKEKYKFHWTKDYYETYHYYLAQGIMRRLFAKKHYLTDQRKRFGWRNIIANRMKSN